MQITLRHWQDVLKHENHQILFSIFSPPLDVEKQNCGWRFDEEGMEIGSPAKLWSTPHLRDVPVSIEVSVTYSTLDMDEYVIKVDTCQHRKKVEWQYFSLTKLCEFSTLGHWFLSNFAIKNMTKQTNEVKHRWTQLVRVRLCVLQLLRGTDSTLERLTPHLSLNPFWDKLFAVTFRKALEFTWIVNCLSSLPHFEWFSAKPM